MISNVVFDLGNVLISFIPSEFLKKKNYPSTIRNTILRDVFQSEEWKMFDNGVITVNDAIDSISLKSALKREEIALVFNFRRDIMFPLDDNVRLLPALKKHGFGLYYLSNFPLDMFEEVSNDYYFFRYFDGGTISAEAKMSKPDVRFYRHFLEKYSLNPAGCLYIDDIEENTLAAETTGMQALLTNGALKISDELGKVLGINF